jgi:hypothetical protein
VGIHYRPFQLISKIASKLGYHLSVKEILAAPTVAALARKIEQQHDLAPTFEHNVRS